MLRADFLVTHLPGPVQRILLAFGYLLGAAFFLMIITGGWEESVRSYVEGEYEGEGALRVPSWPARWTVLVGSGLAMLNYLVMAYIDIFQPELLDSELALVRDLAHRPAADRLRVRPRATPCAAAKRRTLAFRNEVVAIHLYHDGVLVADEFTRAADYVDDEPGAPLRVATVLVSALVRVR